MEKITEQQYREIIHGVPWEKWDEPQYRKILDQYYSEANKSLKRGTIVSGLVSLVLIGSLFLADTLTSQEVKSERETRAEQMAKEMPYGIR